MAVDIARWGIIYCPKNRNGGRRQWQKIQRTLNQAGIEYDFVQSENSESVERLARMLISNGYRTIVVVGGDSALNDVVNCLMEVPAEERDNIALGVVPNGILNDFARFWDFRETEIGKTIEWLKRRRVRKIDIGRIDYTDEGGSAASRYFLNCVNVGLTADIMNLRKQTHKMLGSTTLSFIVSSVLILFHRMEYKMHLKINSAELNRKIMTVCVGNSRGYGQTPNAVPYNGLLDVSVVCHPEIVQLVAGLWLLFTGRFLTHKNVSPFRTREVDFKDYGKALVGVDGRLLHVAGGKCRIGVEQEVVNFIIPS